MSDIHPIRGLGKVLEVCGCRRGLEGFIGRKVVAVWAPAEKRDVAFELADGSFIRADPEGDCCSSSWVEHVSGVAAVIGKEFVQVNERPELATHQGVDDSGFECLALYGITLITEGGERVDIDYRNESNGYYGGWLNWVHDESGPPKGWLRVTEDF